MYEFVISEIKKKLITEKRKYVSTTLANDNYILLLYLRSLCNKNKLSDYQNKKSLLEIIPKKKKKLYENFFEKDLNELLIYFQNHDINDLTKAFTEKYNYNIFDDIENLFIKKEEKTCYLFNVLKNNNNLIYFGINYEIKILLYEMLDKINFTKRNIVTNLKDINLNVVDNLVIIDEEPVYRYIQNENIIDKVSNIFNEYNEFNGNIILKTSYSKVSKLKNNQLINYLVNVCLYEKKQDAILVFNRKCNSEFVNIVMINDSNYTNIKDIINNTEENSEYLLKVPKRVIISNNYRLGFNMYLPNRTEEVKSINDIIDENTRITEEITRLNKLIQQEMDKLISK